MTSLTSCLFYFSFPDCRPTVSKGIHRYTVSKRTQRWNTNLKLTYPLYVALGVCDNGRQQLLVKCHSISILKPLVGDSRHMWIKVVIHVLRNHMVLESIAASHVLKRCRSNLGVKPCPSTISCYLNRPCFHEERLRHGPQPIQKTHRHRHMAETRPWTTPIAILIS